ncbi:MAG: DUF3142 domain-containing protein [Rhodanobacteraceae bacterium]|nr:DUF3142 domain-containing protein [Rhodanobacteraceae bacterium]
MTRRRPCIERVRGVLLVLTALLAAPSAANLASPPLTHSVYVWQRVWDAALRQSIAESPTFATSLRVLALQFGSGRVVKPGIDWAALRATGLPVTLVARVDGAAALSPDEQDRFLAALRELAETAKAQGWDRFDLEIDHDCATAQLAAYAQLLARVRASIGSLDSLSITALPAWRAAPALSAVLAQTDASVLQVHAVSDPARGLFDGRQAQRWVAEWALRSGEKPFLVALPAYGARLKLDHQGALVAVESEQRLPARSASAREIHVDPREIAAWLGELRARGYPNLAGIAWFRLPHAADQRAWALRTLRAVITGQPLQSTLRVATPLRDNGAIDVSLHSDGSIDAEPPAALVVDGNCSAGDAANGYRLVRGTPWRFEHTASAPLRAGSGRVVGWLRCADPAQVRVHVSPVSQR